LKTSYLIFGGIGLVVLYYLYTKSNTTPANPTPGGTGVLSTLQQSGVNAVSNVANQVASAAGNELNNLFKGSGNNTSGISHPTETNNSVSTTNVSSS
jgi:hypothetical protein